MLFAYLGNPTVAGQFAGRLFAAQSWVALACGLVLLMHLRSKLDERSDARVLAAIQLVIVALLLALLLEYAVAPRILARENLRLWHSVGSAMYLGQWLCTTALLWRMGHRAAG